MPSHRSNLTREPEPKRNPRERQRRREHNQTRHRVSQKARGRPEEKRAPVFSCRARLFGVEPEPSTDFAHAPREYRLVPLVEVQIPAPAAAHEGAVYASREDE